MGMLKTSLQNNIYEQEMKRLMEEGENQIFDTSVFCV